MMKMTKYASLTLLAVLAFSGLVATADEPPELRAGASVVPITPAMGLPIVGNWNAPPATKIHDDLHVRCLVLDNGETQVAFAICDNVGIPREVFDQARKLIDAKQEIPSANVLMAATHTHSGVSARNSRTVDGTLVLGSYPSLIARRIAEGISQAVKNLQPARIGWGGVDEASEVHNRRWYVSNPDLLTNPFGGVDKVRMNPPVGNEALLKPAGPVDPEISFLSVQTREGKPLALLGNYSLHYVGGVPKGEISADYFAAFADRIGEKLNAGDGFVGIMTNGTSGDINNIKFQPEKRTRHQAYERIEQVSELVAQRVAETVESVEYHNWIPMATAHEELVLEMRKPDADMQRYFASLQNENVPPESVHRLAKNYASRADRLAKGPDQTTILLQAFQLGGLGITAIPFEVFAETGLDLKKRNPFADSFTIELANGSYGYLPTPAQHKLGGYETWMGTNRVQLDASDRISDVLLSLLEQLKQDK